MTVHSQQPIPSIVFASFPDKAPVRRFCCSLPQLLLSFFGQHIGCKYSSTFTHKNLRKESSTFRREGNCALLLPWPTKWQCITSLKGKFSRLYGILVNVRDIANGKRLKAKSQQKISNWSHGKLRVDLPRFSGGKQVREVKLNRGAKNGTKTEEVYRGIQT